MKHTVLFISYFLLSLSFYSCTGNTDDIDVEEKEILPYYDEATFTPHWITKNSDSLKNFHSIPPFSLINQEGKTITEKDFEGKIYVTDFFFTSCPVFVQK